MTITADSQSKEAMAAELETLDIELKSIDEEIRTLRTQRKSMIKQRRSVSDLYDELRFEVSNSRMNLPLLLTVIGAGATAICWKYIVAISSLYQNDAFMEADWLPESVQLVSTIPLGLLADYQSAVGHAPLFTMACTSGISYAIGDLVAQRFEGRWRAGLLDLSRCARNALLGFLLHGPLLRAWILVLEGPVAQLAGGEEQWSSLLIKIALDQTFFSVLINLLYASLDAVLADMPLSDAVDKARGLLIPTLVSSWRFWPAVHLVSYSPIIPLDFKLLWIDVMEIVWVAILSASVNDASAKEATPNPTPALEEPVA